MPNRIMLNQTSYFGKGAINEIANEVKNRGCVKFKIATKISELLDKEGIGYEIYDKIKSNPTIENVKDGVAPHDIPGIDNMDKRKLLRKCNER